MIKAAITLYLHGRDFNQVLQKYLHLPHPNTIKSYFGTLNTSGSLSDCQKKLLMSLTNSLKNKNIAKSLPMKFTWSLRWDIQGNHIICFSHDEPIKAAKIVLANKIAPMVSASCICLSTNSSIFSKTQSFLRINTKIYHSYSLKRRLYLSSDGWQSESKSSMFKLV